LAAVRRTTPVGPFTRELGQRIRAARKVRRWTLEELAARAGTHYTYLSDLERGRLEASFEQVARLADALGMTVATLYPDEGYRAAQAEAEAAPSPEPPPVPKRGAGGAGG
jgi:transcriptional regulator with XRE-family HTH domain